MSRISAVVISLNEEANIRECLDSLAFCFEKIVVDSGSVDKTAAIAADAGACVTTRSFTDFASQKNFAISMAAGQWVLLIDADERVTPELAFEIQTAVAGQPAEAFYLLRHNRIFGRWMRHGENREDWQLRLIKKEHARFEGMVHERVEFSGKTGRLKRPLLHFSTPTISAYIRKLNIYSNLESQLLKERGTGLKRRDLTARPLIVLVRRWFLQGGILDGVEGFLFGALSAYYEFVRRAKYWELKKLGRTAR